MANAEPIINDLIKTGHTLHTMIGAHAPQKDIDRELLRMTLLNQQLSVMENGFSSTLGEGARWLEDLVLKILLTLSLTIGSTSIIITISVSRGIEKGVNAIVAGAGLVSAGQLNGRVQVYSNDEIGMVAIAFNNMTDQLEQNLRELRDKEEKLKKERDKAESSEKVKQLFLMNMSHEIRTPMNAILGFAHLLEDSLNNKEQKDYIQLLIRAGDELLMILNDILDFSKMESGNISLENMPFNLKAMVETLADDLQPKARAKSIRMNCYTDQKIPDVILGDPKRLNQILLNLLSNAVKFTDRGEVGIAVYLMANHQHHIELEFSVKDTGIGIAEEHQEKIFERFEQAATGTERKFGGTGLGLSIVKQLVELQGGKVFVNSTPGRGSEFHFRLTLLKVKTGGSQNDVDTYEPMNEPFKDYQGPRILVVDDNPMNRLLVIKILKKKGYEADWAENGKVCIDKFDLYPYDLILMDLQMPEMDGYEATSQIRNRKDGRENVPIIAMTAHALDGEKEKCMALGMDEFIPKPFNPDELYQKIDKLLK
jgi:signal transduction histidine kinase